MEWAKIGDLTVGNSKIMNAAITNAKIADLAVDNAKISYLSADKIIVGVLQGITVKTGNFGRICGHGNRRFIPSQFRGLRRRRNVCRAE